MKIADMHCDTLTELKDKNKDFFKNDLHISLEKVQKYSFYCQVMAVWTSDELKGIERYNNFIEKYELLQKELEKNKKLKLCFNYKDYCYAKHNNRTALFLAIEGAGAIDGCLDKLDYVYKLGVRFITLTWNASNELADGVLVKNPKGLYDFGKLALQRMEQLGIVADVSHLSEKGFWDIIECTQKPFAATHSNAKAICSHKRNLTDKQLIEMKNRDCIIGLNLYPLFLSNDESKASIDDILRHTEHMLSLGLENNIALGCDFDGVSSLPKGICGIDDMDKLYEAYLKINYPQTLVDKIFIKNFESFIEKQF